MRVSIIGGSGLVGNGIASVLAEDHTVRVYGSADFDENTLKFRSADVFNCDLFVHAAGITDESVANDYGFSVFKSNLFIKYVVDQLDKTECSQIVYISTIHAFGDLSQDLSGQTRSNPLSIYGLLHFTTEKMFEISIKRTSMNYLGLRIPTVYGFPKNKLRVTRPNIIQYAFPLAVKNSNSITLKTSGEQYRLFASNYKVGSIIAEWLSDPLKGPITNDVVQGVNITVKGFAQLCLQKYDEVESSNPNLIIDSKETLEVSHREISVIPKYDVMEKYTLNQFLFEFFNL